MLPIAETELKESEKRPIVLIATESAACIAVDDRTDAEGVCMQVAPRARRDGVIAQPLDHDTVVYETATGTAHRLDATTTTVWQMADGSHSVDELARQAGLTEHAVRGALIKLQSLGLLVGAAPITRRWVLRRRGFVASVS